MANFSIPNAPEVNSLEQFTSIINRYGAGLAQSCRYMVVLNSPKVLYDNSPVFRSVIKDMSFLCEQAEIPGKNITVNDARYYGPNFKYPVQTEYTDITMTFIVRDEMYEKEFFDNWLLSINPNTTYDFEYKSNYVSQIDIFQFSATTTVEQKSKPTYKITLVDAFPVSVAPMGLVWGEEGYHRVGVTFAYTEWKRNNDVARKGYSLIEVFGPGASREVEGSILGGAAAPSLPVSVIVPRTPPPPELPAGSSGGGSGGGGGSGF